MIELSLPSGTLENAIYSFLGGADSVYFGLKEFSARKGAGNFSLSDFRKIRRYAKEKGKKIYITINTLIKDGELEKVFNLLSEIEKYGCDGVIVQDMGVVRIMKNYFPSLKIHASTQAAIHGDGAVKLMKTLGAERVVLSRELSLSEIKKIRENNRDIEIKVFVHGAMCYGFSGFCMASLYKTGRSANRGECAQICRTWFNYNGERIYPFSMKDMDGGERIKDLEKIGVDSVKVEGRMKGNEYDYFTALYYRSLLDNTNEEDKHAFTFLREHSDGYYDYNGPNHKRLISERYTSHEGKVVGKVIKQNGRKVKLNLDEEIKDRDGLMFLLDKRDAYKFSAKLISKDEILLPEEISLSYGTELFKISDSSMNLKKINTESLKEEKEKIAAKVTIEENKVTLEAENYKKSYSIKTDKAEKESKDAIIKALSQSQSDKELLIEEYENIENLFLPLKEVKEIRRDFLEEIEKHPIPKKTYKRIEEKEDGITLPDRNLLRGKVFPWNEEGIEIDGVTYITLSAISYDEEEKYKKLEERIKEIETPLYIGLNNLSDLYYASRHKELNYFVDIYLYATNAEAVALYKDILGDSLKGVYTPPDLEAEPNAWPIKPTSTKSFTLPYFISRSCFRHDSLLKECENCKRRHEYEIEQNGDYYTVYVENCNTVVWKK